jgi:hypothetical protein
MLELDLRVQEFYWWGRVQKSLQNIIQKKREETVSD